MWETIKRENSGSQFSTIKWLAWFTIVRLSKHYSSDKKRL